MSPKSFANSLRARVWRAAAAFEHGTQLPFDLYRTLPPQMRQGLPMWMALLLMALIAAFRSATFRQCSHGAQVHGCVVVIVMGATMPALTSNSSVVAQNYV
jgi:hypothetical protein